MSDRHERIKQRAYELWESQGRPDGKEQEHWEQASQELQFEEFDDADDLSQIPDAGDENLSVLGSDPDGNAMTPQIDDQDLVLGSQNSPAPEAPQSGVERSTSAPKTGRGRKRSQG